MTRKTADANGPGDSACAVTRARPDVPAVREIAGLLARLQELVGRCAGYRAAHDQKAGE